MGDKWLSEVINYERDIKPYRFIKIYAGVGSGKTRFACNFIKGCSEQGQKVPKMTTLLVTSRHAKVEETLAEMGVQVKSYIGQRGNLASEVFETGEERPLEYENYVRIIPIDDILYGDAVVHNQSAVCTNAYIEKHFRYHYIPFDPATHLWDLFDVIIIDEVHSLITDATYQSAPFAVLELIKEYLRRCETEETSAARCKHLIVMTGSPEPFEAHAGLMIPKYISKEYSVFDKCINVVPKKVVLLDSASAAQRLRKILYGGEKAIYFTNHVLTSGQAKGKWHLDEKISVGVSFSDDDRRKALTPEEQAAMEEIEDALKSGHLPESLQLFVTTSRNKEGINISNKDIPYMFVEAHFPSDVIQMAGRVRYGLDCLYIVTDAEPLCKGADMLDIGFTQEKIVKELSDGVDPNACGDANSYLEMLCEREKIKELAFNPQAEHNIFNGNKDSLKNYINYIEDRFPYVRYSFIDNRFKFYKQKMDAEKLVSGENKAFQDAVYAGKSAAVTLVNTWFPNAEVEFELTQKERATELLDSYIGETEHREISTKEWKDLRLQLNAIMETTYVYSKPLLDSIGDYHLTDPINDHRVRRSGCRVLYKGDDPFPPKPKRRSASKRRKHK